MNIDFLDQIQPNKFFLKSYLFEVQPNSEGLYWYLSIIFVVFILAALILIVVSKKKDKIFKILYAKIINLLIFAGLVGLGLIFLRYEGIPYLGSRLFLLILLLTVIIWSIAIAWYRWKILPQKIKEEKKRQAFEKYLP